MKNRWLVSTMCGIGFLAGSATAALAQDVPTENATAPSGPGAATQVIQLKPGQESGTHTVLPADTAGNPNASTQDAHFVWQASAGGAAEVQMGQLAEQRGQTQSERDFGQMLVTDHTAADNQLSGIAETLMLRTAPGPNPMQQAMYQNLQSVPGDQFDATFNHAMIHAHQRTIALFKAEAQSGQNPQLRQFAGQTLPTLYNHLHLAEQLSPMASPAMSSMNTVPATGSVGTAPDISGAINAPVSGNPDLSADQLNARVLNANGQS